VPELIQEEITAENIVNEVQTQFTQSDEQRNHMLNRFNEIHKQLKQNASERAAKVLFDLIESRKKQPRK
jgi:lipid-A-disaccharide synthase